MQADYVIAGAGSSGGVLASRLTEHRRTTVIPIEAGGRRTGNVAIETRVGDVVAVNVFVWQKIGTGRIRSPR